MWCKKKSYTFSFESCTYFLSSMTLCLCRDLDSEFIKKMQIVFFEDECVALSHKTLRCLDSGGDWSVRKESAFCHFVMFLCAKFNENLQKRRIVKQIKMTPTLIQGFLGNSTDH